MKNQTIVSLPFWITVFLLGFNFLSHNALGQAREGSEMKLVLSDPLAGKIKEPFIAASDDKTIYLVNGYDRRGSIHILDAVTLKERAVREISELIDKPYLDGGLFYSYGYLLVKGNIFIISENYDWRADKLRVFCSILDFNGKLLVKDKELFSVLRKTSRSYTSINYSVNLNDSNQVVFCVKGEIQRPNINDKIGEELQLLIFNSSLEKISGVTANNSDVFKEKSGRTEGPYFGNSDDVYMIYLFKEEKKSRSSKPITTLYAFNKKGTLEFSQQLNTPDIDYEYYTFSNIHNRLRFLIYYSNEGYAKINGSIVYDYNPLTKRFEQKIKNIYSDELKANFISAKDIKRGLGIKKFDFSISIWNKENKSSRVINEFAEEYYPYMLNEVNYETGEKQLIQDFDSSGTLVNACMLKTPNVKKGVNNFNRFGWNINRDKMYFVSTIDNIDKKSRASIKDFDESVEKGVFTCKVNEKLISSEWTQLHMPLKKEDKIISLIPFSRTHKIGVVIRDDNNGSVYKFGYFEIPKD